MSPCGASVGSGTLLRGNAVRLHSCSNLRGWQAINLPGNGHGLRSLENLRKGDVRPLGRARLSGGSALLIEPNDRLAAGDGDFAVDHGAFRDGDAAGDDVSVDDGG